MVNPVLLLYKPCLFESWDLFCEIISTTYIFAPPNIAFCTKLTWSQQLDDQIIWVALLLLNSFHTGNLEEDGILQIYHEHVRKGPDVLLIKVIVRKDHVHYFKSNVASALHFLECFWKQQGGDCLAMPTGSIETRPLRTGSSFRAEFRSLSMFSVSSETEGAYDLFSPVKEISQK